MSKVEPLATKVIELIGVSVFVLSVASTLVTFLTYILCTNGWSSEQSNMVCRANEELWSLFDHWVFAICGSVILFFVASTIRYVRFDKWNREFQAEFKLTDDAMIAMMRRSHLPREVVVSLGQSVHSRYRLISPIISGGRRAVTAAFWTSMVLVIGIAAVIVI